MKYWSGKFITQLKDNEVFVFGSNPQGINGAGAAKAAMSLSKGAKNGIGRGFNGSNAYALVTKSLNAGFLEKATGIVYEKAGYCSVSPEQIKANIDEMYEVAKKFPEKSFLVSYQYETYPNGTQKKSLNGYTSQEMLEMFVRADIPENIVFHDSYQSRIEPLIQAQKNSTQRVLNVLPNLMVISPREKSPEGFTVINTTSKDTTDIGKQFSPFYLANIPLYEGQVARNMENAWQFSKVYKEFANEHGEPASSYFAWAKKGWADSFAHRYANGKGNIPLYSFWKTQDKKTGQWQEHKWDYITARKNIYFPLYAKAIVQTEAFRSLQQRIDSGEKIALWDFDGYDHAARNMTYEEVVNEPKYKCGHAFVLYGLLTGQLKVLNNELIYDFDLNLPAIPMETTMETTQQKEYTFFFHLTSPFSNFHPARFQYKDYTFCSNEQFMMFSKAKQFKDEKTAQKIIEINNEPLIQDFLNGVVSREEIVKSKELSAQWNKLMMKVKSCGREVANYDDTVWTQKRAKIVLFGAREKFSQNEDLKAILQATGDTIMVEASPYEKIWGIGLSEYDARKIAPEKWPGLNLLGQVLDILKAEFKNTPQRKVKP